MASMLPRPSSALPDMMRWLEGDWPFGERHLMRVESYLDNGDFVIRCELPGVDPERDIHITVDGNEMRITAERSGEERTERHSEFHYGSFSRTLTLPTGCDTDQIRASYEAGILTIRMPRRETGAREIPVARKGNP